MNTIESILGWSQKELPDWQQDAVRRILTQQSVTDADIDELYAMLRARVELLQENEVAPTPIPAKADNIPGAGNASRSVRIRKMSDLKNVNAIPDGKYLTFSVDNLTIIYGQNGSGKSGYARVLKKACRARDTKEQIHPNIFTGAAPGPAEAKFSITLDAVERNDLAWQDGKASPEGLDLVSVFDSRGARVIVDDDNEAAYLPQGAEVFPQLGAILRKIDERLDADAPATPELNFSGIAPQSKSYTLLQELSATTSIATLETSLAWSKDDDALLEAKRLRILELQSPDIQKKVARLKRCKDSLTRLVAALKAADDLILGYTKAALKEKSTALEKAKIVFEQAAADLDPSKEPLGGVGGESWQALYEAAREYSESAAYPGKPYPAHSEGDRCVLCMQDIGKEARERFDRFLRLMDQQPKLVFTRAQNEWRSTTDAIGNLQTIELGTYDEVLAEIKDTDPKLHQYILDRCASHALRIGQLKEISAGANLDLEDLANLVVEPLTALGESFEAAGALLTQELMPEELSRVQTEKIDLESRKAANQKLAAIKDFVAVLKKQKKIEEARGQIDLKRVTSGGKSIISKELVKSLADSLKTELRNVGADYLPLEVKGLGSEGDLLQKLVFSRAKLPRGAKLTDVLSEGEQRVVAVAGFLAELSIGKDSNPIVFDDPVSSLDHRFRDQLADRIAKEAQVRQVIVFTHDIAFLLSLSEAGRKLGIAVQEQTVRRQRGISGVTNDGAPWEGMNTAKKLEVLEKRLAKAKELHATDMEAYNSAVAEIYGLLREAWETYVESRILNSTVKSHRAGVMTQSLLAVEVTTADYALIDEGMSKCSKWMPGHRKSPEVAGDRPAPDEVLADIQKLQKAESERGRSNEKRQKDRKTELGR